MDLAIRSLPLVLVLTSVAIAGPSSERLAKDTPATTGAATFTAPADWRLARSGAAVILEAPEAGSRVAVVDVKAADAAAAVAAAWPLVDPAFKHPLKISVAQPARDGWDERRQLEYEVSPNERRVVFAAAFRHGTAWTALLVDSSDGTFDKRLAQVFLVMQSLRPRGYQRESFAGRRARPLDAARVAELRDFVATAMQELGVPGVAFSLVDHGKVVFAGGVGVRELGKPTPVDADTLFQIASNSKGLTTLMLARLVDEGKLAWDTPVTRLLPEFKLGDPDTTRRVLVKHLVCACTGMPRQDFEWLFNFGQATPRSELAVLGGMQPTSKFGEMFQYSNLLASAAGFVGGHVLYGDRELGAAYDEAMRTRVFAPLSMKTITFDIDAALAGNHASAHADDIDGKPMLLRQDLNRSIVPLRPAGGAWASVNDLSRYVQLELARGLLPDGKRWISEAALAARTAPQVPTGADETYGMGLEVNRAWGVPLVHHGGAMLGYKSDMMWLPEQGIGAVLLTNSDNGQYLLRPFARRLVEILFDGRREAADDVAARAERVRAEERQERTRLSLPAEATVADKLAGAYDNAVLGRMTVRRRGADVWFDFGDWTSRMASRKNDDGSASFVTSDVGIEDFEFVVGERKGKRALILRDAQHEYVFLERG